MSFNIFAMPPSSIFLLFSVVFGGSNALPWQEAQQTHVYEADAWSPRPTYIPVAVDPARLFRRDSVDVAICGWIGGNSAEAATCSPGSSCIRDTIHGVIGCCATSGPCTAGVYTSCIDMNSNGWSQPGSGLIQDNGVYTCSGTAVCYKNTFPGGYYQYGCGESSWATTVETTYSGQPTDVLLQQVFTGVAFTSTTSSSTSTTSSSSSSSSSSASSSASSSSSTTSSTSSSSTSSSSTSSSSTLSTTHKLPTETPTSSAAATSKKNNTGIIVGSVIGGIAGLVLIGALLFWLLRKKKAGESKAGPFESIHQNPQPPTSGPFQRINPYGPDDFGGPFPPIAAGAALPPAGYTYESTPGDSPPTQTHHQFMAHEEQPLVSEIDDFSQSYHRAIGATVPRMEDEERDTHIHTGDLPDTVTGLGLGVGATRRTASSSVMPGGRTQDRELTAEALRSPVGASVPTTPDSWLQSSTSGNGNGEGMSVPPRSPLRDGITGMGASLNSAVGAVIGRDNAPRYQLVDEARDDVPVLSSPGQLRQTQRMSRNVGWEDKGV